MPSTPSLTPPIYFPTDPKLLNQPAAAGPAQPTRRLVSLDAYRGFVMLLMASDGLRIAHFVRDNHLHGWWQTAAYQLDHVNWRGCGLWDLIQPSFTFIVGVAMPFSLGKRHAQGQSFGWLTFHTLIRSLILIALGIFLSSVWSTRTNFTFVNTLTQIGLGYTFAFLLAWTKPRWQVLAIVLILFGYWLAFALWPLPGAGFKPENFGLEPKWYDQYGLNGFGWFHSFAAHWDKNTNIAAAFDRWWMNLFPRERFQVVVPIGTSGVALTLEKVFFVNDGGYQTLSFIPTLATMLLGLLAGNLLKSGLPASRKISLLILGGLTGLAIGWLLDHSGICPSVKRIWTPSWVLFSGGWACLLLAAFYLIVDCAGWRWLVFPFVVVGMNSIAMYCLADGGFNVYIRSNLKIHFGSRWFDSVSFTVERWIQMLCHAMKWPAPTTTLSFGPIIEQAAMLLVLWLVCLWMYRRKIFLRI